MLEGELSSSQSETIQNLAKYGAERKRIEIDASRLQRMDFVSAGTLFNVLVRFQTQGKQCVILGLNDGRRVAARDRRPSGRHAGVAPELNPLLSASATS